MRVKVHYKKYGGFPLLELDIRTFTKLKPTKDLSKLQRYSKCVGIFITFWRRMVCLEVAYKVSDNPFELNKYRQAFDDWKEGE